MTLKQKAISQTIAIILGIVVGSLLMNVIFFYALSYSVQNYGRSIVIVLIGFLVYGVYGVVLSRLEYDTKLKELISSKI